MPSTTAPPTDRRVQRTQQALRGALLSLLVERGWDDFSVQDICNRADIGRSTFYLHFQSKEELLERGLNDLREGLLVQADARGRDVDAPLFFVRGLLEHVFEQRLVFRAVVGRRSGHVVQTRFRDMVLLLMSDGLSVRDDDNWERQATVRYVAGAFVELLSWWLDSSSPCSLAEIERLYVSLTLPIIKKLGVAITA